MANHSETIRSFHETKNFGTRENLLRRSQEAHAAYRAISNSEIRPLVEAVLNHAEPEDAILTNLACFQPGSLVPFHDQFIEKGLFYPGLIFHEASEQTTEKLVALIDSSPDQLLLNHLLTCVAWAGNQAAQKAFARWKAETPVWVSDLHVPPEAYAAVAGWELTAAGTRRDLFTRTAFPLVAPGTAPDVLGVTVGTPSKQTCPWCSRRLVSVLDIDPDSQALKSLKWQSGPFQVLTCDVCCCFGTVFSQKSAAGDQQWHPANSRPDYLPNDAAEWDPVPEHALVLSGETRHFMTSANWLIVAGVSFSQVGGLPTWVQDAEYPPCPDCSATMQFIGQVSNEDYDSFREGIYYCFVCFDCGVTATSYQQS